MKNATKSQKPKATLGELTLGLSNIDDMPLNEFAIKRSVAEGIDIMAQNYQIWEEKTDSVDAQLLLQYDEVVYYAKRYAEGVSVFLKNCHRSHNTPVSMITRDSLPESKPAADQGDSTENKLQKVISEIFQIVPNTLPQVNQIQDSYHIQVDWRGNEIKVQSTDLLRLYSLYKTALQGVNQRHQLNKTQPK